MYKNIPSDKKQIKNPTTAPIMINVLLDVLGCCDKDGDEIDEIVVDGNKDDERVGEGSKMFFHIYSSLLLMSSNKISLYLIKVRNI